MDNRSLLSTDESSRDSIINTSSSNSFFTSNEFELKKQPNFKLSDPQFRALLLLGLAKKKLWFAQKLCDLPKQGHDLNNNLLTKRRAHMISIISPFIFMVRHFTE